MYVGLTAAFLGLALTDGSQIAAWGVVLWAVLIVQLARRRSWAWVILMLVNLLVLLASLALVFSSTTGSANGHVVSVQHFSGINPRNLAVTLILAGLEWCLWSRSMRRYVDGRYPPEQPRPRILPRLRRS